MSHQQKPVTSPAKQPFFHPAHVREAKGAFLTAFSSEMGINVARGIAVVVAAVAVFAAQAFASKSNERK